MHLDPQWIVGFIDGEACFYVGVIKRDDMATKCQIQPELTVVQHELDVQVLYALKAYFGCGTVKKNHDTRWGWNVKNLDSFLKIIIPFFEKHQLKTKRRQEFETFRKICFKMKDGDHLNPEKVDEVIFLANNLRVQTPEQAAKKAEAKAKREAKKAADKAAKIIGEVVDTVHVLCKDLEENLDSEQKQSLNRKFDDID